MDTKDLGRLGGLVDLALRWCINLRDLWPLGALRGLRRLDLEGCSLVEDLGPLSCLERLAYLSISFTAVRAFEDSGFLALRELDASSSDIEGMPRISCFPSLRLLDLRDTSVHMDEVIQYALARPRVRILIDGGDLDFKVEDEPGVSRVAPSQDLPPNIVVT